MEDYDELERGPDKDGSLDLSHNGWRELPSELYDIHGPSVIILNFSHNRLPQLLGNRLSVDLVLLKELNVSHNAIERIDPALGRCIRLRKLNLSFNRIRSLPSELCGCTMMVRTPIEQKSVINGRNMRHETLTCIQFHSPPLFVKMLYER